MTLARITTVLTFALVGISGCAGDPGKKVNAAEAELTSEQQKAQTAERDKNAEATSTQEAKHATAAADKTLATSDAKKDVSTAHADLTQDRRDFDAKTKERLAKIDAKAKELKTKSAKLNGKKATDFKALYATFTSQRSEATTKVTGLGTSANEEWSTSKTDVEKKLENLEATLGSMESTF